MHWRDPNPEPESIRARINAMLLCALGGIAVIAVLALLLR